MSSARPYVIGLTGNIACGKSLVLKTLRELGAETFDADLVAHEVMRHGTPAWRAIVERFGEGVVGEDGEINRRALGAIVFADPAALEALDQIVHPATVAAIRDRVAKVAGGVAVIDAIKLFEAGLNADCDEIWVVDCTREQQIERLMRRNNLTREAAIERIDAQPPQTEKRARADRIIDNSGAPDDTVAAVRALWETVRERIQRPA
ncbi:MAG TPA: dephospho-CoA kinase [Nitrolancea sp.]|nr:dephospho-CoA kinase [Nitrolancea sp.]